ncbi:hypothetical protein SAMN04487895_12756 [Paenibacillus sophorae]|uniref:Uncharacterized protein n=1 Tax=Paenibacillus sophorae TaxID=1333845 RepID=A0A1H8VTQ8_9BACL|nr:hypothetical protein [Paenibacillus sophorae]QWU15708.1 hypothetical protein KP014_28495 [Paenibacillus sophorae]SEP18786.1 hypothetical protein SAMN04487895_12756 [Paenibacillus sophorae]
MDKLEIFRKAFMTAIPKAFCEIPDPIALDQSILYGVRLANRERDGASTLEGIRHRLTLFEGVMACMTLITPRRLVQVFPIAKFYDGERWQIKDYFTTVKMIEEHGWDKPISDPHHFIWDYGNWEMGEFLVRYMSLMSDMRRAQGQPGIMEEWLADKGVPMYTMHTDPSGRQFMVDPNGRSFPVRKPRPKHLKIVQSRRVKARD